MKDNKKKVKAAEEAKKGVQPEEKGTPLTDEELAQVTGGLKLDPERLRRKVEEVYPTS